MIYIKIFQNTQALSVSVRNNYYEDHLIHISVDNFHQGGKYTAKISIHQAELRRELKISDQKFLSITSIKADYLNL